MATPLALTGRRPSGGVTVFSPRALPQAVAPNVRHVGPATAVAGSDYAAQRRAAADAASSGQVDWTAVASAFADQKKAKSAEAKQKKAQQEAEDNAPLWQKVVKVGLTGLAPATVPLKAVTALATEATKHLPMGVQQSLAHPFSTITGQSRQQNDNSLLAALDAFSAIVPVLGQDPEKVQADKRSFLNKIAPTSTFGSQDVYQDIGGYGATGLFHLGLDVVHDPLTFLGAPEARLVTEADHVVTASRGLRTALKAAEVADAAKIASEGEHAIAPTAETLARVQNSSKAADRAAQAVLNAQDYVERAPTMERKVLGTQRLPHTRAERAQLITDEMYRNGPVGEDMVRRFSEDFRKGINEGWGAMSPEARDALGLEAPRMRVRVPGTKVNKAIPGTEVLTQAYEAPGRALRKGYGAVVDRLPGKRLATLTEGRMPRSAAQAYRLLRSSSDPEDAVVALTFLGGRGAMRRAAGRMSAEGSSQLRKAWRQTIKKMDKGDVRSMLTAAEREAEPNVLNHLARKVAETYSQISGRPLEDVLRRDWQTYVPHVIDPRFVRYLRENGDDDAVKEFKSLTRIVSDDTMEAEGHIDSARTLTLNEDGTPKQVKLGDKTVTIDDDSIGGLNKTLREAFPNFKGSFYSEDPAVIMERYVADLSYSAGQYAAGAKVADAGLSHGFRIEGDVLDALNARNAALAQEPEAARVLTAMEGARDANGKLQPGAQVIPERPIIPGSAEDTANRRIAAQKDTLRQQAVTPDQQAQLEELLAEQAPPTTEFDPADYFESTEHREATKLLAEQAHLPETQTYLNDLRSDVETRTTKLLRDVRDIHEDLFKDIRSQAGDVTEQLDTINARIKGFRDEFDNIKTMRTDTPQAISDVLTKVEHDIVDLEAELKRKAATFKGKSTKAQNAVDKQLAKQLDELKQLRREAQRRLSDTGAERVTAEINARQQQLFEPVRQAEAALQTKIERFGQPFTQAELDAVERMLTERGTPEQFAELFNSYQASANPKVGQATTDTGQRLVAGRLSLEEQRAVDLAAERTTKAIRPTSDYMQAHHDAVAAQARIDAATTRPELMAARRDLREIDKRFQPGGDLFDERKARSVLARQAGHEAGLAKATAKERQALEAARELSRTQQESIVRGATGRQIRQKGKGFLEGQERNVEPVRAAAKQGQPTEAEAIEGLREQLTPGSEAHFEEAKQATKTVKDFTDTLSGASKKGRREEAARVGAEADAVMGPAAEQVAAMKNLAVDLNDKNELLAKRAALGDLTREMKGAAVDPKSPLDRSLRYVENKLDDIRAVAAANPNATDDSLAAVESLLDTEVENLRRTATDRQYQRRVQKALSDDDLPKIMTTTLKKGWVLMHDGLPGAGDTVMSTRLHQMFVNVYQANRQPKLFGRTFNALTNLFKTYATLTPGFHIRNALSGIFMNLADGVGFRNQLQAVKLYRQFRSGGTEWLERQPEMVRSAFEATFASGAKGFFGEGGVADRSTSLVYNKLSNNPVTRLSTKAGEWVEGPLRLAMALDSMKGGHTTEMALERIARVHFDYSDISNLDESAKRIVPFWTFLSRNLPLQVMEVYHNPRWYSYYQSFQRDFSAEPDEFTPDYWGPLGVIPTGWHKGANQLYLDPDIGLTRANSQIDQMLGLLKNPSRALADVNPLIMAPIDYITKRDSFYDRSFDDTDYTKVGGPMGYVTRLLAKPFGQVNEQGQVSENFVNLVRSINPAYDRSARVVPQLMGEAGDPQRVGETYWRQFGIPVRVLSDKQKQNEALRRYYEANDEVSRRRSMAREAAS